MCTSTNKTYTCAFPAFQCIKAAGSGGQFPSQSACESACIKPTPPPAPPPPSLSTWAALENAIAGCESKCSTVLTKGFNTPLTGFRQIDIGSDPVHISIDGKGMAVIDARGKCEKIVVACTRGDSMLIPPAVSSCTHVDSLTPFVPRFSQSLCSSTRAHAHPHAHTHT